MTREEANKELERAFDVLDRTCHMDNRRKEAFNMARVALSAEPCEDAISREYILSKAHCCCDDLADDELCCVDVDDIKNAPSVKPKPIECEDCISRAEAIKALNCKISGSIKSDIDLSKYKREFQEFADMIINAQEKAIQALPPVTPKPKTGHWIPVSERLPDAQKEFGDKDFSDWVQVCIRINAYQSIVCSAYYCFSEKKWYMERMGCGEILAWMPLPKPYTAEKE